MTISRALLDRLLAEAAASPAREVCGLLFGGAGAIADALSCANAAADPADSFEVDPAALFAAHRRERGGGPALLGHYHSHPRGPAAPSARDAAAAGVPGRLWIILGGGGASAWREVPGGSVRGGFVPVRLIVGEG